MSIFSERNIFYTLKQQWIFLTSFYSFEGVRYFWVELCIFSYKLPSATNQQLFSVTESDIGQGPSNHTHPSMNHCFQYCDLNWALVKWQWLQKNALKIWGTHSTVDILTSYKNLVFSSFIFPALIGNPNNTEVNALTKLVISTMFLLPKSASLMSLVSFPGDPL